MSRVRAVRPWRAVVLAAFVPVAVAACSNSSSSSSSSAPAAASTSAASATASASAAAPSAAGTGTQTSALCTDLAALHGTVTGFAHLTPSTATGNTVSADIQTMTAELNNAAHAAHGKFTSQVDGLKSALATLRTQLADLSHGTASVSNVTNAAKNVDTRANDLAAATKNACPSAASSSG